LFGLLKAPIINRLNEINIPTLILFGKNDLLIPNKSIHQTTTEEIAIFGSSKIKNNRLVLFDKCGHFLQFEKPALFNSNIISFIE
jgi:pimeloyl-ACP methyl ester carboxylesterase